MSERCCEGMDYAVDNGNIEVRFRQEVFTVDGKQGIKLVPFYTLRGAKKKQPAMVINFCPMCGADVAGKLSRDVAGAIEARQTEETR